MMALTSFIVGIIAVVMTFIKGIQLPGFAIGMLALIFAIIAGYKKDKEKTKTTQALELGAIIVCGTAVLNYLIQLFIK